jgi:hypothetical protein
MLHAASTAKCEGGNKMPVKFIELAGTIYNVSQIKSVEHKSFGKERHTVVNFIDGAATFNCWDASHEATLLNNSAVVPAEPGFMFMRHARFEGEDFVEKLPIVAWAIDVRYAEFATMPITVDGLPRFGLMDWAVLQPDGVVVRVGEQTWPNYEAWLEDMRRYNVKETAS